MSMSSSSNDPSFSHKNGGEVLGSKLIESMCNLTIYIYIYYQCKENRNGFFFFGWSFACDKVLYSVYANDFTLYLKAVFLMG
jgi:hypothetical protein